MAGEAACKSLMLVSLTSYKNGIENGMGSGQCAVRLRAHAFACPATMPVTRMATRMATRTAQQRSVEISPHSTVVLAPACSGVRCAQNDCGKVDDSHIHKCLPMRLGVNGCE